MPNAVYDDEDQRVSDDDLRSITGIDPDEEASIEASARADEASSLTPEQLSEKEAEPDAGNTGGGDALESRFGNMFADAREKDSFYKGKATVGGSGKSLLKRKGALGAMGGAGLVAVIMGVFMFNFLHTFQMDHFFKNTEAHTSKRLKASLDTRNKSLTKAYIKMRVAEYEGKTDGETLFFKGDKVGDGKNPLKDWYATLRKNKFEESVFGKQGISFVSIVDNQGNISTARITALEKIHPDLVGKYLLDADNGGPISANNIAQKLSAIPDKDLERMFVVDKFDTHKAARKAVKEVVDSEVPWYRVFKRRHVRKDVESVAGIKSWRLFEKTRDKLAKGIQARKDQLYAKMIDIFFGRNPNTANLLKCIFSNGSCARSSDVADPQNGLNGSGGDDLPEKEPKDDEGKQAKAAQKAAENEVSGDLKDETQKLLTNAVEGEADKGLSKETAKILEGSSISKRLIYTLIAKVTGQEIGKVIQSAAPIPSPDKIWTIAKWMERVDDLFGNGETSKLSMMVKNAKRAQLIGLFATYSIASDQMKSGELVGDQLQDFFATTQNIGNSEGWLQATGRSAGTSDADKVAKKAYCEKEPSKRSFSDFSWYCDDQNPGNGGNAAMLSNVYEKNFKPFIGVVAGGVRGVKKIPGVEWVSNFIPDLIGKVTEPLVGFAAETEFGKNVQSQIGALMMKLVGVLGGGPMFDGSSPGIGNLLVAGGAAQAEASTRQSGGAASTKASLDYTNKLATNYDNEQKASESLFDRYASLDNPDSFAASTLFAVSNKPITQQISSLFTSLSSLPTVFGNMLSGRAFAADPGKASDISDWAGVDKYDIPPQCQGLDPLDPDYLSKSSNVSDIGLDPKSLDWEVMRNGDKFWEKVYGTIKEKEMDPAAADKIYNCAIFDSRVMGNIGGLYGYTGDNAYSPEGGSGSTANTGTNGSSASNANLYWVGDSYTVGAKAAGLDTKLQANGWSVTSNGLVSRHMTGEPPSPGGIQQMDADKAIMSNAGAVVVALGTNDLGAGDDAFNSSLQTTYDKVKANAPNAKIFWVNYYLNSLGDHGKGKTDLLAKFASSHSVTVIDYAGIAPPIPYTPDGIHPTNYGPLVDKAVETIGKAPSK